MAHEEIKKEICSKHGISINELSRLVCLRQAEKEVKEESSIDSIKDCSEIKNFNSNRPNEFDILKKAREKISSCFFENLAYSKLLENTANSRVSS
ncbi:MAG: hypothetical protein WCY18_01400 [Methanofastidiosum sp.]|jgi:hypothetical protein